MSIYLHYLFIYIIIYYVSGSVAMLIWKKSATNTNIFFVNIREKMKASNERECDSCADLLNKLKEKNLETEALKNDLEQSENSAENFKIEYKAMK